MKECFTCKYKISTELTQEQRKVMHEEELSKGVKFPYVPEMIFHCKITGKRISQIDPACDDYRDDAELVNIRKMLSKSARKLRQELNNE